jgi:hypothetical protein
VMTEVWAVSKGEYSDYSILGLFSTKEKAQAFADAHNEQQHSYLDLGSDGLLFSYGSEASVEERPYPIDEPAPEMPKMWFSEFTEGGTYPSNTVHVFPSESAEKPDSVTRRSNGGVNFTFYRATKEHALRAAREMQRAVKAGTVVLENVK